MKTDINIIVVDDNLPFLEGLVSLLRRNPNFKIIGLFGSGDSLIKEGLSLVHKADIVLIDIEMPGLNGIETIKHVNKLYPALNVIALTMYQDTVYLKLLIESGFKGFINKTQVTQTVFQIIDNVLTNNYSFPDSLPIDKKSK